MSNTKIPGGYILLSRKIIESEIWNKPPLYAKVWIYLLTRAQHSDYKGLKKGQLRTSIPEIIEGCKWNVGCRIQRPTKDQIYRILSWLRKPNEGGHESNTKATMIATTKATHGMVVTIDNYCFYQAPGNYESNDESSNEKDAKDTRKQRRPNNINKNDKNDKNDKNIKTPYSPPLEKINYAEYVTMTNAEYEKLISTYGKEMTVRMVEILDNYKGSSGKEYKSDYRAILNWVVGRCLEEKGNHSNYQKKETPFDRSIKNIQKALIDKEDDGGLCFD